MEAPAATAAGSAGYSYGGTPELGGDFRIATPKLKRDFRIPELILLGREIRSRPLPREALPTPRTKIVLKSRFFAPLRMTEREDSPPSNQKRLESTPPTRGIPCYGSPSRFY